MATTLPHTGRDGVGAPSASAPNPDGEHHRRRIDRLLLAGAIAVVVLPIVGVVIAAFLHTWYPANDNAVIELQTMDVPRHLPLFGVFSRYEFHHPGPAMFLAYAAPYRLLGPRGLLLGAGLINAASVALLLAHLQRRGGRVLLGAGTIALLLFEWYAAGQLLDPWNAWVAVLPFALALVLTWSVWERDWWALPLLAAVVTFIVEAHLGYAVLAAWLLGSATVWALLGLRRRSPRADEPADEAPVRCRPRILVISALILVVGWALPVWQQLRGPDGNLALIAQHFSDRTQPLVGWAGAAGLVYRELGIRAPWLGGDEPLEPFSGAVLGGSGLSLVPLVVAVVLTAALAYRRRAFSALRLQVIVVVTALIGYVSMARITGDPYPYIFRWTWVLGIFAWLSAGWSLWSALQAGPARDRADEPADEPADATPDTPAPSAPAAGARPAWRPALLVGTGVLVVLASLATTARAIDQPLPQDTFSAAIAHLVGPTEAVARTQGNLLVLPEGVNWGEVQSGLIAELERRGVPLIVRDENAFMYGQHRAANGRPIDNRLVVATNEAVAARQRAGSVPIVEYDPLTPPERVEYDGYIDRYDEWNKARQRGDLRPNPLDPNEVDRATRMKARGPRVAVYLDPGPLPADFVPPPEPDVPS